MVHYELDMMERSDPDFRYYFMDDDSEGEK